MDGPAGDAAGAGGRRVTLAAADGSPLEPEKVDLPSDRAPVEWLGAWLDELTRRPARVPVVEAQSSISPNRKFYLSGGLAGALVLAFCAGHGGWLAAQTATAKARADKLATTRAQFAMPDKGKAEEAKLSAETEKLRSSLNDLLQQEATLSAESDRAEKQAAEESQAQRPARRGPGAASPALPELLAALADAEVSEKPSEVVVKEVRQLESGELRLTGICSRTRTGDAFATKLGTRLGKRGWKVGAADKRLREDRMGFDFAVLLTPVVLGNLPIQLPPNNTTRPSAAIANVLGGAAVSTRLPAGGRHP